MGWINYKVWEALNGAVLYAIPRNGQSLSVWVTTNDAVITAGELDGALLFNGVSPYGKSDTPIVSADIETTVAYQDTQSQGAYTMLDKLSGGKFLFMPHGKGGSSVVELSPPSVMYSNGIDMLTRGSVIADSLQKSYRVPLVQFIQGETGYSDRATDQAELRSLQDNYITDVGVITGQNDLPMVIDQTGAYYSTENARSRAEYVKDNVDCFMATPKYMINRLYPNTQVDWVHLNPEGYVIQEEYHGIANQSVIATGDFKHMFVDSYQVVGNTVELTMSRNGVTLDAVTLPQCPANGFTFTSYIEGELAVTSSVVGDKVVIDVGQAIRQGDLIDYGYSLDDSATHPSGEKLPCGNIRDNSGTPSLVAGFTLHNWLEQFDYTIQLNDVVDTNKWRFEDPVTAVGLGYGSDIAGVNYDLNLFPVIGDVYSISYKHNGVGQFRQRFGSTNLLKVGTGAEEIVNDTVTISSLTTLRNTFQEWKGGFVGTIYDISIELQE